MTLAGRMLGRYRLEEPLGQGGMAEVWRGTDTKLARTVALKVILPQHARDPQFVERFLREARVVASLEHPNILPVYDFGEEEGSVYLVMPYMDGGTLRDRMLGAPVPLSQAAAWIRQLADALDAAHAAGVLHRDVKPANVLVGKGDRLALADFGIAKMLESQTGLTATGMVVGTPVYMAPEQAQGKPATAASDRYALAVLAYELLSGRPPFDGESALALMHQHVTTPAPALSTKVRGLPAGLDAALERGLSKDPAERPPSCRSLADSITAFAPTGAFVASVPVTPPTRDVTAPTMLQPVRPPSAPVGLATPPPSLTSAATVATAAVRRKAVRNLAYLGIGVAVVAGAVLAWTRMNAPAPPAAAVAALPTRAPAPAPPPATTPSKAATAETAAPPPVTVVELPRKETAGGAAVAPAAAPARTAMPSPAPPTRPPASPAPAASAPNASEDPELDADSPLREAHRRLDHGRAGRRPSRDDFAFALAAAEKVLAEKPGKAEAKFLGAYAKAGLAYMDGREGEAGVFLAGALFEGQRLGSRESRRIWLLQRGQKEAPGSQRGFLAVALGDPKRTAGPLLAKAIADDPSDARAYLGRAILARIEGRGEAAIADARTAWEKGTGPGVRSAAAEVLGEELAILGRHDESLTWLHRQVSEAPREARGRLAMRAAKVASGKLKDAAAAREFLNAACQDGNEEACRETGGTPASSAAERPHPPRRPRPGT